MTTDERLDALIKELKEVLALTMAAIDGMGPSTPAAVMNSFEPLMAKLRELKVDA
jgi:hypothetical protein